MVLNSLIEKQVILLDHLDNQLVVAAHIQNVFGPSGFWSEDVWSDTNCQVVRCHFVEWLILHNHLEDLNVEFKRVKIDSWQLLNPVLELQQRENELDI